MEVPLAPNIEAHLVALAARREKTPEGLAADLIARELSGMVEGGDAEHEAQSIESVSRDKSEVRVWGVCSAEAAARAENHRSDSPVQADAPDNIELFMGAWAARTDIEDGLVFQERMRAEWGR